MVHFVADVEGGSPQGQAPGLVELRLLAVGVRHSRRRARPGLRVFAPGVREVDAPDVVVCRVCDVPRVAGADVALIGSWRHHHAFNMALAAMVMMAPRLLMVLSAASHAILLVMRDPKSSSLKHHVMLYSVFDYYITAAYVIFQRNLGLIADC